MPSWPVMFPMLLKFRGEIPLPWGTLYYGDRDKNKVPLNISKGLTQFIDSSTRYSEKSHLSDEKVQMLYECEQERKVYKSCLREVISLKKTDKHTSWKTADISALYLS